MFEKTRRFFNTFLRSKPDKRGRLSVFLDEEAFDRLERLRQKLRTIDDNKLVGLSLKALESKTDRIIMMHITKKVPKLKREGLTEEEIAKYFNHQDIPVPAGKDRWDADMISSLIGQREGDISS